MVENDGQDLPQTGYVDFAKYRTASLESYKTLWDYDLNFAENTRNILEQLVILPQKSLQLPVLLSTLLAPTPMCNVLPIIFCVGEAGSGKSTIGIFFSLVYGCSVINASSSPASIRNLCQQLRFGTGEDEKPYLLIWDDIKSSVFLDQPVIYSIFRSGYERKSDLVTIAGQDGVNMEYRVFGGRLTSSIEPIFNHWKLSELQRRTFPVIFKRFKDFSQEERLEAGIDDDLFDVEDKLDLNDYDWDGLHTEYLNFWRDEERLLLMSATRTKLSKTKRLKDKLKGCYILSRDPIGCGVAMGLFSLDEGVEIFSTYYEKIARKQFKSLSSLESVLSEFITERTKMDDVLGKQSLLTPSEVKTRINSAQREGELDEFATPQAIAAAMTRLGWSRQHLNTSEAKGHYWVKTARM